MIHGVEHDLHGAERMFELDGEKAQRSRIVSALEIAALLREGRRMRALEREDRLLVVAYRKDRALQRSARAFAGRELAGEALDHGPLGGARILCLVDEHMVDAE